MTWVNPYPEVASALIAFFFVLIVLEGFLAVAHETVNESGFDD